jgi:UDP-N-acetylmuramate--alanine ligase
MIFRRTRSIHFVGIGGVGMSGIAEVLLTLGYKVTGSDISEGARVRNLDRKGAEIAIGHRPENVHGADVVVKTSAVGEDNPEVQEAKRLDIPVIPRAEMLAELMRLKQGIAVAGTHGKTTTTAMVSTVLQNAGYDPTVVVGGRMHNMSIGARLGTDDLIVVEADESDGSFLHLNPVMSIVTNIDDDHMDYYESMEEVEDTFLEFMNSVPFYGFTAACGDDERLSSLVPDLQKPFQTYGFGEQNKLRATHRTVTERGTRFTLEIEGRELGEIDLQVPGEYNVLNALGAAAVGFEQGIGFDPVRRGLEAFEGVARRFDFKGESEGLKVYDDYAHHPTEIEKTLAAADEQFDSELIVIFQPHRYSRTREHADQFGGALQAADALCVTDVYAAGEEPIEGVDLDFLRKKVGPSRNGHVTAFESGRKQILDWVREQYDPGRDQVLFTMGAGDVVDLSDPILERVHQWSGSS